AGAQPGRRRDLGKRLALDEQGPAVGKSRSGPEEWQPLVRQLTGEANRRRGECREDERYRLLERCAQAQRSDALPVERQASPAEQRPDGDERRTHPSDRLVPGEPVQALDERRAASPSP